MGVGSGRGQRGTRRRVGRDGVERRGYSSLIGDSQRDGYRAANSYGDQRGYGQDYGQTSEYGPAGGYAGPSGYDGPGGYSQPGRHATSAGRALSADLNFGDEAGDFGDEAGRGGRTHAGSGGLAAFLPGSGRGRRSRRTGSRRRGGSRLGAMPVPALAVVAVVVSLAVVAAAVGATHVLTAQTAADAAAPNANCTLIVPATGTISIYDPLVVDAGTQPAVTPTVPTLPAGGVVALWFGYNGNTLTLAGADQAQSLLNPAASATPTGATPATTPPATQSRAQVTPASSASGTATATPAGTSTATATPTTTSTSTTGG